MDRAIPRRTACPPPPGVTPPKHPPDYGYDPINLDDDADLQDAASLNAQAGKFRDAARLLRVAADTMDRLGDYCDRKARAREARLAGRIAEALGYENFAEAIYRRLPQWARW